MQASVICFTLFKQEAFLAVARRLVQRRQQHRRQDTDDGNDDEYLDHVKTAPPQFLSSSPTLVVFL